MNIKKEKCVIIGPSGSGKDYLMRKLVEKGLKGCVKMTTRPQRKSEIQGITYNFVNDNQFNELIKENKFLAYQTFNVTPENKYPETWLYGITKEDFSNAQAFIMTPGEINQIPDDRRKELFIVYLDIDREVRESRISYREDKNDSIKRRLDADEIDFKDFNNFDLRITDPDFDSNLIWELMD